ncbi:Probable prolyl 4-hydroxylase [Seminavis robusta]|uniref:Probable prolyl 4-hydroxylase n=1 Tax=Seminavis robusta TaxID=568900 RepID=A0A9N8ET36_9STRA|nr:Probable prolyl 4-hydroxylase [Seminavis robusta]|eukprot:Sro1869_g302630.1 Probable prolyl 4-hydroxylase (540) ;mRNA; f:2986-5300
MVKLGLLVTLLFLSFSVAQECDSNGNCDTHERCSVWVDEGECIRNQDYMKKYCPVACKNGSSKTANSTSDCKDLHPRCRIWRELGECLENPSDMNRYCKKSCDTCKEISDVDESSLCLDKNETCAFWASKGECIANPGFMEMNCAKSCNTCEKVYGIKPRKLAGKKEQLLDWSEEVGVRQSAVGTETESTLARVLASKKYWEGEAAEALPSDLIAKCRNLHGLCSFWAYLGECDKNPAYMATNCGPACHTCHLIDIKTRCPRLEDARPGLQPGSLNKMFERIVRTAPGNNTENSWTNDIKRSMEELGTPPYTVTVHSRPSEEPATQVDPDLDKSLPPWVITFDNFMTEEECDAMIQLGYKYKYKVSEDVGAEKADGTFGSIQSKRGTSEKAWCSSRGGCREEEIPSRIHERIARVLDIPAQNSEDFQILRYEKNLSYRTLHDYIPHQKDRQCGPRILTFFMYLSDVEKGGGTNFPQLDIIVEPKKGRALLWPSVYDSDPFRSDSRFYHQAQAVEEGANYAVYGWIHMYDYVTPQAKGCN